MIVTGRAAWMVKSGLNQAYTLMCPLVHKYCSNVVSTAANHRTPSLASALVTLFL
jgi:hypothetical protein